MANRRSKGRRDNNTGSIYKDGSGYRVQIQVGISPETGKILYKKRRCASHEEAVAALKKLERELDAGKLSDAKDSSFAAFLDRWLELTIKANRAPSTHRQYKWLVDTHIKPHLGRRPLQKIERKEVQALLALKAKQKVAPRDKDKKNQSDETLSKSTLRLIRAVIHAAYQDAIADGLTGRNPAADCDLPNVAKAKTGKTMFLTPDQAIKLQAQCDQAELGDLLLFMLHTGTRLGEATGLRWDDVHLGPKPFVHIHGQLQRLDKKLTYRPTTKTNQDRAIPLTRKLADVLKGLQAKRLMEGVKDPDGIVFLNAEGRRVDPKYANSRLKELCRMADVPEISPHKLRHTCATLITEKSGIHATQKILGHSQVALTSNLYAHATAETLRPAIDTLSRLDVQG